MARMLNAVFTEDGVPKTGLVNAVIYIYDLSDNSLDINGAAVSEVAKGGYKYNFTTHDTDKDYYCVWDSVDLLLDERYAYQYIMNSVDVTFISDMKGGQWEVTGNQLICYKADNVTEVCRFNLFDSGGNAASINTYKRVRVP